LNHAIAINIELSETLCDIVFGDRRVLLLHCGAQHLHRDFTRVVTLNSANLHALMVGVYVAT
jgi:hypothetical protein